MVKLNGCIFGLKMKTYWENIIFRIKPELIVKKNLIVNLSTKVLENQNKTLR